MQSKELIILKTSSINKDIFSLYFLAVSIKFMTLSSEWCKCVSFSHSCICIFSSKIMNDRRSVDIIRLLIIILLDVNILVNRSCLILLIATYWWLLVSWRRLLLNILLLLLLPSLLLYPIKLLSLLSLLLLILIFLILSVSIHVHK